MVKKVGQYGNEFDSELKHDRQTATQYAMRHAVTTEISGV